MGIASNDRPPITPQEDEPSSTNAQRNTEHKERTYQGTSWIAHPEKYHGTQTCWLWISETLSQSLMAFWTRSAITASYLIVAGMEALDLNFFKSVFSLPVWCLRMTCK